MIQLSLDDYIKAHGGTGILTNFDVEQLQKAERKIFELMQNGKWHKASEIREAACGSEGLRRMRALRRWFTIERKRDGESRNFLYRLVIPS